MLFELSDLLSITKCTLLAEYSTTTRVLKVSCDSIIKQDNLFDSKYVNMLDNA